MFPYEVYCLSLAHFIVQNHLPSPYSSPFSLLATPAPSLCSTNYLSLLPLHAQIFVNNFQNQPVKMVSSIRLKWLSTDFHLSYQSENR